jgi:hypothetical protein
MVKVNMDRGEKMVVSVIFITIFIALCRQREG